MAKLRNTFHDWFVLVTSGALTLLSVVIAIKKGEPTGFAGAAFFGGCTVVVLWSIKRKRRLRQHIQASIVHVQENVPLQANPREFLTWAVGLGAVGIAMAIWGNDIGTPFVVIGVVMAALGSMLSLAFALKWLPRLFLQFEREGLRFGHGKFSFLLEWSNIAAIAPGELSGHDLLLFKVHSIERVLQTTLPQERSNRVQKMIVLNQKWYNADLVIMCMQYGTDAALLAHSIKRYVSNEVQNTYERALQTSPM